MSGFKSKDAQAPEKPLPVAAQWPFTALPSCCLNSSESPLMLSRNASFLTLSHTPWIFSWAAALTGPLLMAATVLRSWDRLEAPMMTASPLDASRIELWTVQRKASSAAETPSALAISCHVSRAPRMVGRLMYRSL